MLRMIVAAVSWDVRYKNPSDSRDVWNRVTYVYP